MYDSCKRILNTEEVVLYILLHIRVNTPNSGQQMVMQPACLDRNLHLSVNHFVIRVQISTIFCLCEVYMHLLITSLIWIWHNYNMKLNALETFKCQRPLINQINVYINLKHLTNPLIVNLRCTVIRLGIWLTSKILSWYVNGWFSS